MAVKPPSILLLAENENAAALDRRALRECGYPSMRFGTSGITAARWLADKETGRPDLIVCQGQLEDMDGEQFCAIIRQHPQMVNLPILLILASDQEAQQLCALGCEASAVIGRPYSLDALKNQIEQLVRASRDAAPERAALADSDLKAFNDALATYGVLLKADREPQDFFRAGVRCLEEQRWAVAIAAFERALADEALKGDSELGLAAAWRGKGDQAKFRLWLAQAIETFLAHKKWNKALKAQARMLQHDPAARNPFLGEAHKLARQSEYAAAAEILVEGLPIIVRRNIGERYARVCLAAPDPEQMFDALTAALKRATGIPYEFLTGEIRTSLDLMERQKEDRQRAQAAERKWELSRTLKTAAARQAAQLSQPEKTAAESFKKPGQAPLSVRNRPELRVEKTVREFGADELEDTAEKESAPFPLFEQGSGKKNSSLLWSVIKFTWKLARKADKKS